MKKKAIYEPRGRALEYSPLACDLYNGCTNGCKYCLTPETLVTMSDGHGVQIKDLKVGEEVVGVVKKENGHLSFAKSIILDVWETRQKLVEIHLSSGTVLRCSENHRWLTNRGWKYTTGDMSGHLCRPYLTTNNFIRRPFHSPSKKKEKGRDYKTGYLQGVIIGDGHVGEFHYERCATKHSARKDSQYKFRLAMKDIESIYAVKSYLLEILGVSVDEFLFPMKDRRSQKILQTVAIRTSKKKNYHLIKESLRASIDSQEYRRGFVAGLFDAEGSNSGSIRIHNTDMDLLEKVNKYVRSFGFKTVIEKACRECYSIRVTGGIRENCRFFNVFDPAIKRKINSMYGKGTSRAKGAVMDKVEKIVVTDEYVKMFDVTTSTENFIANGCISHNCYGAETGTFENMCETLKPIPNILSRLEEDAKRLEGDPREILFSFTSDPYFSLDAALLTRAALEICEKYSLNAQILTKGGMKAATDFDILKRNNWRFGSTIIFADEELRKEWEPNAPSVESRIDAVRLAHDMGIYTWVSVEPVIDPESAVALIESLKGSVDLWKIGKLNHFPEIEAGIDWPAYLKSVMELLKGERVVYKKDLIACILDKAYRGD